MDQLRSNCVERLTSASRNQKTVSRFRQANGFFILYVGNIGSTHHVFQAEEAPEAICNFKYSKCWGQKSRFYYHNTLCKKKYVPQIVTNTPRSL